MYNNGDFSDDLYLDDLLQEDVTNNPHKLFSETVKKVVEDRADEILGISNSLSNMTNGTRNVIVVKEKETVVTKEVNHVDNLLKEDEERINLLQKEFAKQFPNEKMPFFIKQDETKLLE